jgi:hypothetical protein
MLLPVIECPMLLPVIECPMLLPVMDATVEPSVSAARLTAAMQVNGTETKNVKCLAVLETLGLRGDCKLMPLLFILFLFLKHGL